jgi:hypothetical protein
LQGTPLDDFTVSISSIYDEPVFSSEGKRREQGRVAREEKSEEETVRKGSQALDDPGLILAPGTLGNVWGNSTYQNEENQESQLRPTSGFRQSIAARSPTSARSIEAPVLAANIFAVSMRSYVLRLSFTAWKRIYFRADTLTNDM